MSADDEGKRTALRRQRSIARDAPYPKVSYGTEDVVHVKHLQKDVCVRTSNIFRVFATDLGKKPLTGTDLLRELEITPTDTDANAIYIFAQLESLIRCVCDSKDVGLDGSYTLKPVYMEINKDVTDPEVFANNCRLRQIAERAVLPVVEDTIFQAKQQQDVEDELEKKCRDLGDKNASLIAAAMRTFHEREALVKANKEMEQQLDIAKKSRDLFRRVAEKNDEELEAAKQQNAMLTDEVEKQREAKNQLEAQFNQQLSEAKKNYDAQAMQVDDQWQEVLQKALAKVKEELYQAQNSLKKYRALNSEMKKASHTAEAEKKALSKRIKTLEKRILALEKRLEQSSEAQDQMRDDERKLNLENLELIQVINGLEEENNELKEQVLAFERAPMPERLHLELFPRQDATRVSFGKGDFVLCLPRAEERTLLQPAWIVLVTEVGSRTFSGIWYEITANDGFVPSLVRQGRSMVLRTSAPMTYDAALGRLRAVPNDLQDRTELAMRILAEFPQHFAALREAE